MGRIIGPGAAAVFVKCFAKVAWTHLFKEKGRELLGGGGYGLRDRFGGPEIISIKSLFSFSQEASLAVGTAQARQPCLTSGRGDLRSVLLCLAVVS